MSKPLPRWLFKKYAVLWVAYKDKIISIEEIRVHFKDKSSGTSITDMVECGWITRLSIGVYQLNSPENMTGVITNAK